MEMPNWNTAPEGATHFDPEAELPPYWYKLVGHAWFWWSESKGWVIGIGPASKIFVGRLTPRPTVTDAWSGTGLPPVGTLCEIHGTVGQELHQEAFSWRQVEIIAHTDFGGSTIAVGRDIERATLGWGLASKFRPLRTPEQIAAAERAQAIRSICRGIERAPQIVQANATLEISVAMRTVIEALYDAGYITLTGH